MQQTSACTHTPMHVAHRPRFLQPGTASPSPQECKQSDHQEARCRLLPRLFVCLIGARLPCKNVLFDGAKAQCLSGTENHAALKWAQMTKKWMWEREIYKEAEKEWWRGKTHQSILLIYLESKKLLHLHCTWIFFCQCLDPCCAYACACDVMTGCHGSSLCSCELWLTVTAAPGCCLGTAHTQPPRQPTPTECLCAFREKKENLHR